MELFSIYNKNLDIFICNIKLSYLIKIICLRKSQVSAKRILVFNVIEKLAEHGIHSLPCSYTNDIMDLLPHVMVISKLYVPGCHSAKVLSTIVSNSLATMVQICDIIDIGAWHTVYAMLRQFFNDVTN